MGMSLRPFKPFRSTSCQGVFWGCSGTELVNKGMALEDEMISGWDERSSTINILVGVVLGFRECPLSSVRRQADPGSLKSDVWNHLGSKFNLCFSKVDCILFFLQSLFLFFNLNVLIYRVHSVPCTYHRVIPYRIKSLL